MALYGLNKDKRYYDYSVECGEKHNWGMRSGDRRAMPMTMLWADLYCPVSDGPQAERIKSIKASIDNMVQSQKVDDWTWIDALQMAMPVFAKLGVLYKDNSYFEKMYEIYMFTKEKHGDQGLYNPAEACVA